MMFTTRISYNRVLATCAILCLLSWSELVFPFSPVIANRVDSYWEQKEKVAPHDSPGVVVQLQEGLVRLSTAGLYHLVLTSHLDNFVDGKDSDAEDSGC